VNLELSTAVDQLKQNYDVLGEFKYSEFLAGGEKALHDWLRTMYQESYEPTQRIVFIQDCDDVYDYQSTLGSCTLAIQQSLAKIDISNWFVVVVTSNPNIVAELSLANSLSSKSPDVINSVVVLGEYVIQESTYEDTFCILPWMHLYIGPEGDVLPCCAGNLKHPLGHIDKNDLAEIYNNEQFQTLRQRMLNKQRTQECTHCWIKEDSGLPSLREFQNQKYQHLIPDAYKAGTIVALQPKYVDIRINKLCNLKCRSCSPYYSSAIAQEIQELYNVQWPALNNKQRSRVLEEILSLLPSVEDVYFAGGEPILAPEHFAMLSELVRLGQFDTKIFYNTNFMQLEFRGNNLIDLWKNFDSVTLGASLDAYGAEAEYLRHGTVWATIESNLKTIKSADSNIGVRITSTLGLLNTESLIQLQRTWTEQGLASIQDFSIPQIVFDSYLSIQVLPEHHKHRLEPIIKDHISWLQSIDAGALANRWQQIIDYMWGEDRSHLLPEFQRITKSLDLKRGESFGAVFPQFRDLLPLNS
jgi:radical SAM protein with 4Fe4S-binding SPASM domain